MTRSGYPFVGDESDVVSALKEIQRLREQEDVPDFTNLNERFVMGRSSVRVPSTPTDVESTDEVGDIVNDATHEFKLLDISGTPTWDRRALDTAW